jgi:hypothetical protein
VGHSNASTREAWSARSASASEEARKARMGAARRRVFDEEQRRDMIFLPKILGRSYYDATAATTAASARAPTPA